MLVGDRGAWNGAGRYGPCRRLRQNHHSSSESHIQVTTPCAKPNSATDRSEDKSLARYVHISLPAAIPPSCRDVAGTRPSSVARTRPLPLVTSLGVPYAALTFAMESPRPMPRSVRHRRKQQAGRILRPKQLRNEARNTWRTHECSSDARNRTRLAPLWDASLKQSLSPCAGPLVPIRRSKSWSGVEP